ncbi:MerR family transcriptional regulator [Bailinhaonella thermotolerans]|uniref:MerR family transcriptional regulator n=1 Tax=Bailinhaonella thermotolerans TaxID=1070861 RepID=A0A3A4B964_9ACTN|nr:MerR family transcriptional regulator [Bailinhaonella thermotolerans]RJL35429.1 MerR family transcriptional regulator [Bailinhaonella thermotolerans]
MKISEIARDAEVTTKAIRYYESLGLLTPARLGNGYRDYSAEDVRRVREIRDLNRLGIPVERTRPFLECLEVGHEHGDDCPSSLAGYRAVIDELTGWIEALTERRAVLVRRLRDAAARNMPGEPDDDLETITMTDVHDLPAGLPVPEDDGAAGHLPGMTLPEIELRSSTGETVRLDALGDGRHVLYVLPLIGTPDADLPDGWDNIPGARGCTPEACDFRDHYEDLIGAGAAGVFGMSLQEAAYLRGVAERLRLPYAMLADTGFRLADALGLPTFHAGGRRFYRRHTLILREGRIEHVFYPVFPPNEHAQQVLAWLKDNPL